MPQYYLSCFVDGERTDGPVQDETLTRADIEQHVVDLAMQGYGVVRLQMILRNEAGDTAEIGMEVA